MNAVRIAETSAIVGQGTSGRCRSQGAAGAFHAGAARAHERGVLLPLFAPASRRGRRSWVGSGVLATALVDALAYALAPGLRLD